MEDNNQTIEQAVSEQNDAIRFISDEEVLLKLCLNLNQLRSHPNPSPNQNSLHRKLLLSRRLKNHKKKLLMSLSLISQRPSKNMRQSKLKVRCSNSLAKGLGETSASFDDLTTQQQEQRELDERIAAIAEFVENTGRDPRDWFVYQSMNPSEMDDLTAIQVQMASDYPNLSQEEVSTLISSKYKLDPDLYSEDEGSFRDCK